MAHRSSPFFPTRPTEELMRPRKGCGRSRSRLALDERTPRPPIAVLGEEQLGPNPCVGDVLRLEKHAGGGPVGRRIPRDAEPDTRPEEVQLLQVDAYRVRSSLPPERESGPQGPHVAGEDLDIDSAVTKGDQTDPGVVKIPVRPQDPLRLLKKPPVIPVSGPEQELATDHPRKGVCCSRPFGCQPKTIARIDSDERSNPVIGKRTVSPAPEAPAT